MSSATGLIALLIALVAGMSFGAGILSAFIARSKSYRPWFWLFSMGPIGLSIMVFKTPLSDAKTPEERERWEQLADWTGGILSAITLVLLMVPAAGILLFFARSTAVIRPTPAPTTAPANVSVQPSPKIEKTAIPQSLSVTVGSQGSAPPETGEEPGK